MMLVFDEVQSFRVAPGGAQERYGVVPDITCLAKIIGGGFPVGAVGAGADMMDACFDPRQDERLIPHGGTLNGNPVTTAAGLATMTQLTPEVFERMNDQGAKMRAGIKELSQKHGVPVQAVGDASLFKIFFTDVEVVDYRASLTNDTEREYAFFLHLLNNGVFVPQSLRCAISTVTTDAEIERFLDLLDGFLAKVAS